MDNQRICNCSSNDSPVKGIRNPGLGISLQNPFIILQKNSKQSMLIGEKKHYTLNEILVCIASVIGQVQPSTDMIQELKQALDTMNE